MTFHGEGHRHGDGRQADTEHHADQQDRRHAEKACRRLNTKEVRHAENHENLHRRDRHDEDKAAQDDGGSMDRRGHQPLEEPVFLVEQQIDPAGQAVVQDRHHDDPGREEADVIGSLHDLGVRGSLKKIAEEDEPEQHRLYQGEQHAEFFPAQSSNPPHRQRADFLPIVRHMTPLCRLGFRDGFGDGPSRMRDEHIIQARTVILNKLDVTT